jgi:hypothetical protein
VKNA